MIVVIVRMPMGREIFVNGDYDAPRAISPEEMVLERGAHKFETLDANGSVDNRGEVPDGPDSRKHIIDLVSVVPPEPTS
jgi:hypothetical protein